MHRRLILIASIAVFMLAAAATPEEPPENPWSDTVRELLKPSCGKCHQSTRPTHKKRALAVFDLDAQVWYSTLSEREMRGLVHRAKDYREEDRMAVSSFVACVIDGNCTE